MIEKSVTLPKSKTMARKQIGVRLEPEMIDRLKKEAKRRNRSVTNLIETWIKEKLDLL